MTKSGTSREKRQFLPPDALDTATFVLTQLMPYILQFDLSYRKSPDLSLYRNNWSVLPSCKIFTFTLKVIFLPQDQHISLSVDINMFKCRYFKPDLKRF